MNSKDNVVLFPKLQKLLEEESLAALQGKRYEEALGKLNHLLSYHVDSHEIHIGKLICLMELGRYSEAQELCEQLIHLKNEDYYHYVHIYLTILFQTNQFKLLMEQIKHEFEQDSLPESLEEQFRQLYDMSEKMQMDLTSEQSVKAVDAIFEAVNQENHIEQWRIIEELRSLSVKPESEVLSLLTKPSIHPVIKTAILIWMREQAVSKEVEIHKFDATIRLIPKELPELKETEIYKEVLLLIQDTEQKNPSLFALLKQLLYRYIYVTYPFLPTNENVTDLAEALKDIGNNYLDIHIERLPQLSNKAERFIQEIRTCDSLYLSVIEE